MRDVDTAMCKIASMAVPMFKQLNDDYRVRRTMSISFFVSDIPYCLG